MNECNRCVPTCGGLDHESCMNQAFCWNSQMENKKTSGPMIESWTQLMTWWWLHYRRFNYLDQDNEEILYDDRLMMTLIDNWFIHLQSQTSKNKIRYGLKHLHSTWVQVKGIIPSTFYMGTRQRYCIHTFYIGKL